MIDTRQVQDRRLELAVAAGRRWEGMKNKRAAAVRDLKLGGPLAADSPERVKRYLDRESLKRQAYARAGVSTAYFAERRIGPTLDLDDLPPNEAARTAGMPVGRLVDLDGAKNIRLGFATGFLIAPGLILTNHHVFADPADCRGCGVQFGFERIPGRNEIAAGSAFELDPDRFFFSHEELDFAVVAIGQPVAGGRAPLGDFATLKLIAATGKILVGQAISIIQYPDGGPKKYGVRDNELLVPPSDADLFLEYSTDTLPGSSGSPAFNKDWEVVALHHSGVPEIRGNDIMTIQGTAWHQGMPDSDIHWVANEGVRVSCICAAIREAKMPRNLEAVQRALVATFTDDLSSLPALQQPEEASPSGVTGVSAAAGMPQGLSITVNGTANFYLNGRGPAQEQPASRGEPAAVVTAPALEAPVLEKKLRFDPDYDHRPGYDQDFLGIRVPAPGIAEARAGEILSVGDNPLVLKYHHYSLVMNRVRRLVTWAAVNVDYTESKRRKNREDFGTDTWVADPRIPGNRQIQDPELYQPAAKFDRGHVVRRDDTAWGDTAEEEILANSDSFHWTNCTPQHEQFNRAAFGYRGLWGELENHIQTQAKNVGNRMTILAGPMLDNANDIVHDFGAGEVKIPKRFWKVLLVTEDHDGNDPVLRAYGFVLDQEPAIEKYGIEKFSLGEFDTYQVSLADIADAAGVTFRQQLLDADAFQGSAREGRGRRRLESLREVVI